MNIAQIEDQLKGRYPNTTDTLLMIEQIEKKTNKNIVTFTGENGKIDGVQVTN